MADEDIQEPEIEAKPKGPGLMSLIKAVAVIAVIVLLEVAVASKMLPSAEETTAIAVQLAAADAAKEVESGDQSSDAKSEGELLADEDMREVSLGDFHVLTYSPDSGSSLNVDFELYGIVLADEESEFFQLFDSNQRRIREQVLITIRGTEVTDLTDAGLGLIKRKILEKTNRALGRPLLSEVVFSKFSFMER